MLTPVLSEQDRLLPISMTSEPEGCRLTVLHVGTLNKPIGTNLGYMRIPVKLNADSAQRERGFRRR